MKKNVLLFLIITMMFFIGCSPQKHDIEKVDDDIIFNLSDVNFSLSQLCGEDELGRKIYPTDGSEDGKYVGIVYYVWFGRYHTRKIYDISKLLEKYEDGIRGNMKNPLWAISGEYYNSNISPNGEFHYWDEPIYGYYDSEDPWIIKKHMELFCYAEIDYIALDLTNRVMYPEVIYALLSEILSLQKEGFNPPKLSFSLYPTNAEFFSQDLKYIYDNFVSKEEYKDCFFVADEKINPSGKPFVVGRNEFTPSSGGVEKEFWIKTTNWPGNHITNDSAPGLNVSEDLENYNGFVGVTPEIFSSAKEKDVITWCSDGYLYPNKNIIRGRGYYDGDKTNGSDEDCVKQGLLMQYYFDKIIEDRDNISCLSIVGFNEWWAQKQAGLYRPDLHTVQRAVFVDTFSAAFSRDIEPTKGDLGDLSYMQTVQNIRQFKHGKCAAPAKRYQHTINIKDGIKAWSKVKGNYLDLENEIMQRKFKSVDPDLVYNDTSARNDVVRLKMTNDEQYFYCFIETKQNISEREPDDKSWMNLHISHFETAAKHSKKFVVNRELLFNKSIIEQIEDNSITKVGECEFFLEKNRLYFAIPLKILNIKQGDVIAVKATDGINDLSSINEFYTCGDSAPIGSLNFAYFVS